MGNTPSGTALRRSTSGKDQNTEYYETVHASTIQGNDWPEFVQNLKKHISDEELIKNEWEKLAEKERERSASKDLFMIAQKDSNREKNRYYNILPFDKTRVHLQATEGVEDSDYINANFVNGLNGEDMYICCQAPLDNTFVDFFRMVWETDASIIVMLTRFIEGGKLKASDYLPPLNEDPMKHGDFYIQTLTQEPKDDGAYIVRKITLRKSGVERTITQFHFVAWPDHGVPEDASHLLNMMSEQNTLFNQDRSHPVVVHCSAGIGRTGTYVIVSNVLEQAQNAIAENRPPPPFNLMKVVHELRGMRSGMVNHYDQYFFCYKTILTYVERLLQNPVNK
eukprot:TRINITY_DN2114_c0_g1_i1.p1 TRINITY_DN2114_c0_g1~~TRINITY_DN2114_c0_g1_i1.p1  ORF type:complete len:337 (+),score=42.51 TRINITY_DN2114_c0_g1_i1:117-1127(+)